MSRRVVALAAALVATAALASCASILGIEPLSLRERDASSQDDASPEEDGEAPSDAAAAGPAARLATGGRHSCYRGDDGRVLCWGDDSAGQAGTGEASDGPRPAVTTPRTVKGIDDAVDLALGEDHSCAARASGGVACWGDNFNGQLGDGSLAARSLVPVAVGGIDDAIRVASGAAFTCALRRSGAVSCWGANFAGQLGDGSEGDRRQAVTVKGLDDVRSMALGEGHACALRGDGSVRCWGDNFNGQLGTGDTRSHRTPTEVSGLTEVTAIAATERSTCALEASGRVSCWGSNSSGELGNGVPSASPVSAPVRVPGLSDAIAIGGGRGHVCVILRARTAVCWGANASGQLGGGVATADAAGATGAPVNVRGLTGATSVRGGGAHSCAEAGSSRVECWGANESGQLGDGTTTGVASPVSVIGL